MGPDDQIVQTLYKHLVSTISETNGLSLKDTLELLMKSHELKEDHVSKKYVDQFLKLLSSFHIDEVDISTLLGHPLSIALFNFFKNFPISFCEEHIHLTGSLSPEFVFPRIKKLLSGKDKKIYEQKIIENYGEDALPINSVEDVEKLLQLKEGEQFDTYLRILYLPKLLLTSKKAHVEAAYHMASELYQKYNVGKIRLKFTLSRHTTNKKEQIPGLDSLKEEDVVLGLYDGFMKFKKEQPIFDFVLSPSFRKEEDFFDNKKFENKKDSFDSQVSSLLKILKKYPQLKPHLNEVDTVGNEQELYRKRHFVQMQAGLRRLQFAGFRIRSHHGETWHTLKKGIQSVDNAMNIWQIDTLEHGLSLGINPNYYFHRLFQKTIKKNRHGDPIKQKGRDFQELSELDWKDRSVFDQLIKGKPLSPKQVTSFLKSKFRTAREIENYQHDILNRLIQKRISLVTLPSSNMLLTGVFPDYKDHPFSWWEKKGVRLGIGTDNYITLRTNYIQELLILLYIDSENLKITKALMVATRENRRTYMSKLLWDMRKSVNESS